MVSRCRQQIFIDAPREVVWQLIADVEHHPDWWPGVIEVECDQVAQGCEYKEVIKVPMGTAERQFHIDAFDDPERFDIKCVNTGAFVSLELTSAQDGTFVDAEAGMEPRAMKFKVFDTVMGKRYFTRWLEESLEGMRRAAGERETAREAG
jgi:carbon monoxide dehydrogenase subunit G